MSFDANISKEPPDIIFKHCLQLLLSLSLFPPNFSKNHQKYQGYDFKP
jgi:hypothetical protein